MLHSHLEVTLVHSREKLLSSEPLPDDVKDRSLELLGQAGVHTLMSHRLDRTEEVQDAQGNNCLKVYFTNGHTMLADKVIMAVSNPTPCTAFLPSDVLNSKKYVRIQPTLALLSDTPHGEGHFAVGDITHWSGIKRCGGAMHMGKSLFQ